MTHEQKNSSSGATQDAKRRVAPYLLLVCLMTWGAHALHVTHWRWADFLDNISIDHCFETRGPLSPSVVSNQLWQNKEFYLIEIPDKIERPVLSQLIRQFSMAKVVAIDMMLDDRLAGLSASEVALNRPFIPRWQKETNELVAALSSSNNVVIGMWPERQLFPVPGKPGKSVVKLIWQQPSAAIWNAARYHCHLRVEPSPQDGITRQLPLFQTKLNSAETPGSSIPSLSLAVAAGTLDLPPQEMKNLGIKNHWLTLGPHQIRVPRDGSLLIDYLGKRDCFDNNQTRIRYDVALKNYDPEEFKDKIIFIGATNFKAKDDFTTPFGDMPGVMVHMNATATLLSAAGPPQQLRSWQTAIIALVASLCLVFPMLRFSLWGSLVAAMCYVTLIFLFCEWLFVRHHSFFPISVPVIALVLTYNGISLYEYGRARAVLGRFVGKDIASAMLNPLRDLRLGGKTEVATAFFCDLRQFSTASERLSPEETEPLVNAYTEQVSRIAGRFGGRTIDYFGDGVFVLFRENEAGADHALQAARTALAVQEEVQPLIHKWSERSGVHLKIGIGLNSGPMHIGVVGSESHMKMGAVGDAVNVASRIQGLTERCGFAILVTKECSELIAGRLSLVPCGHFAVKGREQEVEVFGIGEAVGGDKLREPQSAVFPLENRHPAHTLEVDKL